MTEQAMRFRLGIFVLATLILLGVLTTLFGGFADLFTSVHHYTVTFDNAPGVAAGTPVRRSGVRIGQVKSIDLDNDTGRVQVQIEVEAKYTLRHEDQPKLVRGILGGDSSIDFVTEPTASKLGNPAPLVEGETIPGEVQKDVNTLVDKTSELMPSARETLEHLRKTADSFEKMSPLMEQTMREFRDVARECREMIPEWRGVGKATREMIPEWRGVAKATRAMIPELHELTRESRKTIPALRRTGEEIRVAAESWGALGERINVLLATNEEKLQKSLDNLNRALNGMNGVFCEENQRNLTRSFAGMANVFCEENQRNLSTTLKNVRTGSDNLQTVSKNTEELVKESRETIHRVNDSVKQADNILDSMRKAVKPLPERSERILRNLDESTDKLNRCLTEAREFLNCLARSDGLLRRLLFDPSLYNHLDEAACAVTRALPRMDQILRDMAVFADKLARHPEAIGLGGVIRPSSGLKEGHSSSFFHHPQHP
jgi:phospholipid/cholesterol/gamma-HCH transport system substrate-binding protein